MSPRPDRPLSPHLGIYRWGPHMLVSILHRMTGSALTVLGLAVLTWWLVALSSGPEAYETFAFAMTTHWIGLVFLFGLVWAAWQHTLSGLRHLVLDIGAGYELKTNKFWSVMTIVGSALLTLATFAIFLGDRL